MAFYIWVTEKTDIEQVLVMGVQVVKSHSVLLIDTKKN